MSSPTGFGQMRPRSLIPTPLVRTHSEVNCRVSGSARGGVKSVSSSSRCITAKGCTQRHEWLIFLTAPTHTTSLLNTPSSRDHSFSAINGTTAMILVPSPRLDSTEKVPCTRCIRSCILSSPNPRFFFASSTSKPAPASLTTSSTAPVHAGQLYYELFYPAVLHRIMERFLRDAEKAK